MASTKAVLCVGINPSKRDSEETKNAGPSEEIRRMIASQVDDAKDAGYKLEVELIAPDEMAAKIQVVRQKLSERAWDGFIVGGGIRKTFELTEHFESLVNASRELQPQAKLGFNTSPMDLVPTVKRMFEC